MLSISAVWGELDGYYLEPLKPIQNVGSFCLWFWFAFAWTPAQLIGKVSEFGKHPEVNKHANF